IAAGCRHRRRRRPDRLAADAAAEKPGARVPPGEPIAGSPALSFRGLGWASAAGVGHAVWITRIALADPARPARRGYFWVAIARLGVRRSRPAASHALHLGSGHRSGADSLGLRTTCRPPVGRARRFPSHLAVSDCRRSRRRTPRPLGGRLAAGESWLALAARLRSDASV